MVSLCVVRERCYLQAQSTVTKLARRLICSVVVLVIIRKVWAGNRQSGVLRTSLLYAGTPNPYGSCCRYGVRPPQ